MVGRVMLYVAVLKAEDVHVRRTAVDALKLKIHATADAMPVSHVTINVNRDNLKTLYH